MNALDRLDQAFDDWVKNGNGQPLTQREIDNKIGCTHQFIGQLERAALKKLREQYCSKGDKNV